VDDPKKEAAMELRELMTPNPTVVSPDTSAVQVAGIMRDQAIGDVLVKQRGSLSIVTDRDIVTRAVATGRNPQDVTVGEICTADAVTVEADTSVEDVIRLMSDKAVRRVPVVDGGNPIGIVSIGDLALDRDRRSLLGDISAAPPNS
jgi:CBS domain-containing protein